MEAFVVALNIAVPIFIGLIIIESLYGRFTGKPFANAMDTISSLSSGITNTTKSVLGLSIAILSYTWLERQIGIFDLKATWWVFLLAFVGKDFAGYWIHRMEHKVNYLWNRHLVHHSSEEFNLACALRQSISEIFSYTAFFLLPLAIIGVPGEVYAIIAPIQLFAQFWYHTRHINKMGVLEYILVTPSHHRVHHAINPEYIDKNFSQIFIIWDKLFGTFQPELDEVEPVYGIKRPVQTWNPIIINFQHAWLVIKDAWRTNSWKDKARIWFMPTGWRPEDVKEKYPVEIIEDPYSQVKYMPKASIWMKLWSGFQLAFTMGMALYLFNRLPDIGVFEAAAGGFFVFYSVFCFTTLMDRKAYAFWLELARAGLAIAFIGYYGDWLLLSEWIPYGHIVIAAYFAISLIVTTAFVRFDIQKDNEEETASQKSKVVA